MNNLIVGSDSVIGNALMSYWKIIGRSVIGTTRRHNKVSESNLFLNLEEDISLWECPYRFDIAVICAGATKLDMCRNNPEGTRNLNVINTIYLVDKLVDKGAFVIYLSSSQVFNGSKPYRAPDEPISPITEYGWQKADVEHQLQRFGKSVGIVRLTKVIGPPQSLFSQWIKSLKSGEEIQPFSDAHLSPVPLSCVTSILHLVGDLRLYGVLQVSGAYDISYAEAAYIMTEIMGLSQNLVKPIKASSTGNIMPCFTSLNTDRLKETLGIEPPDVRWAVRHAFKKYLSNR